MDVLADRRLDEPESSLLSRRLTDYLEQFGGTELSELENQVLRRRLAESGGVGHVFRNADGRPWTKDALGLRMRRLRVRAGVGPDQQGEQFVLYTYRHTFLTDQVNDLKRSPYRCLSPGRQ